MSEAFEPENFEPKIFEPTRAAGLQRLAAFVPKAGDYARLRNYDLGPKGDAVSGLSPYLRYRLIDEAEVLAAVQGRWKERAADQFVREVFWRSYFKGWLQMRPKVWSDYERDRDAALSAIESEPERRRLYDSACEGKTGIACFDAWSDELRTTGYLHNHARMWFASIWVYTLELPWTLGADFFYRHLLDGDPASNTLSWRWVCGLHTRGKTYLARRDNIQKYTRGRFDPEGLASEAPPLDGPSLAAPDASQVPSFRLIDEQGHEQALPSKFALLVTPEDLLPERIVGASLVERASARFSLSRESPRSPLGTAENVRSFVAGACENTRQRLDAQAVHEVGAELLAHDVIVTPFAPVGPIATELLASEALLSSKGVRMLRAVRTYDRLAWPHATAGFFKLAKKIPSLMAQMC
ncbi:MAG: deoxyribodipyrimidine photo-lyase [Polyangiales bacterium]|jgi:deoxyribodipyrimidine photo-lyase